MIIWCALSFIAGSGLTYLFLRSKPNQPQDKRVYCIEQMLRYVRDKGTLPIKIDSDVLKSIKIIANQEDWGKYIDETGTENLYNIYLKWKKLTPKGKNNTAKLRAGYKQEEEIEEERPEYTTWVYYDSNGNMEEYME